MYNLKKKNKEKPKPLPLDFEGAIRDYQKNKNKVQEKVFEGEKINKKTNKS